MASAISIYSAHCGGLPVLGATATVNCTMTTAAQNGDMPSVLLTQQTNSQNQIGGPFINAMPTLPGGWTGSGASYKYITSAIGTFVVCGLGDGTEADSNGTALAATCP
jgi:hypothetical protein